MGIAVFNYTNWALRYPALAATVNDYLAGSYFIEAGLYLDNTDSSIVDDVPTRLILLNMIVAHIASLNGAGQGGGASSGMVGRVSSVTEGSVSISSDFGGVTNAQAWFAQTTYGAQYWAATARYRTMRYVAGPSPKYNGFLTWRR